MKKLIVQVAALSMGLSLCAGQAMAKPSTSSDSKAASHVTMGERKWVNDVYDGGTEEISLGKLAASKGTNAKVKEFGTHMASGHSSLNGELKTLADKKGIKLDKKASDSNYKKLSKLTGKDFDKEYAKLMVDGHKSVAKNFQSEADKGNDPNLSAWAKANLPMIQGHLKDAEAMQAAVGK